MYSLAAGVQSPGRINAHSFDSHPQQEARGDETKPVGAKRRYRQTALPNETNCLHFCVYFRELRATVKANVLALHWQLCCSGCMANELQHNPCHSHSSTALISDRS